MGIASGDGSEGVERADGSEIAMAGTLEGAFSGFAEGRFAKS